MHGLESLVSLYGENQGPGKKQNSNGLSLLVLKVYMTRKRRQGLSGPEEKKNKTTKWYKMLIQKDNSKEIASPRCWGPASLPAFQQKSFSLASPASLAPLPPPPAAADQLRNKSQETKRAEHGKERARDKGCCSWGECVTVPKAGFEHMAMSAFTQQPPASLKASPAGL